MVNAPNAADIAIAFARSHIGDPYQWGATGPDRWDCSGLVMVAYAKAGVVLPRTTGMMINVGTAVAKADLLPGDLVFPDFHHVQIYTGNGKIIEAPQTGEFVIERPMWGFWRARRVTDTPGTGATVQGLVSNPIDAADQVKQVYDVLTSAADSVKWITDPHNWLRIATFVAGAAFIIVALGQTGTASKAASAVVRGVSSAGST